jgi:uncharacterized membrane protein
MAMDSQLACQDCETPLIGGGLFCPGCGRPLRPGADAPELPRAAVERRLTVARTRVRQLELRLAALVEEEARVAAAMRSRAVPDTADAGRPRKAAMPPPRMMVDAEDEPGSLERLLSGRILAWIGALALLIGSTFFLRLAADSADSAGNDEGWFSPARRVAFGVIVGGLLVAAGGRMFLHARTTPAERRSTLFASIVLALGLGIVNVSIVAATRLYDLVPEQIGLVAALLTAAVAASIAIRVHSQVIAAYGLIFPLAAPLFIGVDASITTFAFVAVAVMGVIAVAAVRGWGWLPAAAFVIVVPQVLNWLNGDIDSRLPLREGVPVLVAFWLLFAIAAILDELSRPTEGIDPLAAMLLLADALFLISGRYILSDGLSTDAWTLWLALVAVAYAAIGGCILLTRTDHQLFGWLASGVALLSGTAAITVRFDGPPVAVIYCASALIFAGVYRRQRDPFSASAVGLLGSLMLVHLFAIDFRLRNLFEGAPSAVPFVSQSGLSLALVLGTLAAAGFILPVGEARWVLPAAGLLIVVMVVPYEFSGAALIVTWLALCVVALAADQRVLNIPETEGMSPGEQAASIVQRPMLIPAACAALFATVHAMFWELPIRAKPEGFDLSRTFTDTGAQAAIPLILAAAAGAWVSHDGWLRRTNIVAALAFTPWLLPFHVWPSALPLALAVSLCLVAGVLLVLSARDSTEGAIIYAGGAALLATVALLETLAFVAPPTRLTVDGRTSNLPLPFVNGVTVACGALIALAGLGIWTHRGHPLRRPVSHWLSLLAAAVAIYALSVSIVDLFQHLVDSPSRDSNVRTYQRQAQVALSILWSVVGGLAFVGGIMLRSAVLRLAGLALLGLATTKVFLYDLSSLDAAYRVVSFIGLGLLLLISSWAYQRFTPTAAHSSP